MLACGRHTGWEKLGYGDGTSPNETVPRKRTGRRRWQLRLQLRFGRTRDFETREGADNILRLLLDALDEVFARRTVVYQADADACAPDAVVWVAVLVRQLASGAGHEVFYVLECRATGSVLDSDYFLRHGVLVDPGGVSHGAKDVNRILFSGRDDLCLQIRMNGTTGRKDVKDKLE